jgi:hypothetical protein
MSDYLQHYYSQLHRRLNELRAEAARYAGDEPTRLNNQIEDHELAIELTDQLFDQTIEPDDWRKKLAVLAVDKPDDQRLAAQSGAGPSSFGGETPLRPAVKQRCEDLAGSIRQALHLISQYEKQRRLTDDPRTMERAQDAIADLRRQLEGYDAEARRLGCPEI